MAVLTLAQVLDQLAAAAGIGTSGSAGSKASGYYTGRLVVATLFDENLLNVSTTALPKLTTNDRLILSGVNMTLIGSATNLTPQIHIYDSSDGSHTQFFSNKIYSSTASHDLTISNFQTLQHKSALGSGTLLEIKLDENEYAEGQYSDIDTYITRQTDVSTESQVGTRFRSLSINSGEYVDFELYTEVNDSLAIGLKIDSSGQEIGVFNDSPDYAVDVSGNGIRVISNTSASTLVLNSDNGNTFGLYVRDDGRLYTKRLS